MISMTRQILRISQYKKYIYSVMQILNCRDTYRTVGEPRRRSTDLAVLMRTIADYLGVDSTRHTIVELGIQLGQSKS